MLSDWRSHFRKKWTGCLSFTAAGWQLGRKNRKALGMQENNNDHVFLLSFFFIFPTLTTFNWELWVIINWFLVTPGCRCGRQTPADPLGMVNTFICVWHLAEGPCTVCMLMNTFISEPHEVQLLKYSSFPSSPWTQGTLWDTAYLKCSGGEARGGTGSCSTSNLGRCLGSYVDFVSTMETRRVWQDLL